MVSKYEDVASRFTAREFIPNTEELRIFTVGYKAVGAMFKYAKEGDFRNNISQGATAENYEFEKYPEITQIAEKLSALIQVEVAGVDIIIEKYTKKPYILEINSVPQFAGLEKYSGKNIAGDIVNHMAKQSLLTKNSLHNYEMHG